MIGPFQEESGAVSLRRILALICIVASIALGVAALTYATAGWWVFLPALAYIAAAIVLLFFTTWADIASVTKALKG
jgi:hypothetical protein